MAASAPVVFFRFVLEDADFGIAALLDNTTNDACAFNIGRAYLQFLTVMDGEDAIQDNLCPDGGVDLLGFDGAARLSTVLTATGFNYGVHPTSLPLQMSIAMQGAARTRIPRRLPFFSPF